MWGAWAQRHLEGGEPAVKVKLALLLPVTAAGSATAAAASIDRRRREPARAFRKGRLPKEARYLEQHAEHAQERRHLAPY